MVPEPEGPGGPLAPQYFADHLTIFEPGRADYPHLLLLAPSMFFTFRHHWFYFLALSVRTVGMEATSKEVS